VAPPPCPNVSRSCTRTSFTTCSSRLVGTWSVPCKSTESKSARRKSDSNPSGSLRLASIVFLRSSIEQGDEYDASLEQAGKSASAARVSAAPACSIFSLVRDTDDFPRTFSGARQSLRDASNVRNGSRRALPMRPATSRPGSFRCFAQDQFLGSGAGTAMMLVVLMQPQTECSQRRNSLLRSLHVLPRSSSITSA